MSLQSMTGFGRGEASDANYTVAIEIKSVNHRFKDLRFKMSSVYNSIEMDLRKMLSDHFKRGSFDIYINFKRSETNARFEDIDDEKVSAFLKKMKPLLEREDIDLEMSPVDFMRGEFMKDQDLSKDESLINLTIEAYSKALEKLKESRLIEGKKLQAVITGHIKNYTENFKIIESLADEFQQSVEEKIRKRFEELLKDVKVDEPRFMQEVVYYLEKMDVHEEINRITGHLSKLDKLLSASGEVGRQIDFMMQELGRETNTIGSKSNMKQISETVVQMKVHLEKIREQSLNLE